MGKRDYPLLSIAAHNGRQGATCKRRGLTVSAMRERDVIEIMELMRERTACELELKHCRERTSLYRSKPAQVFLGGNLAGGERVGVPAVVVMEPLIQYLLERIAGGRP
jgi:hypothetical protein